MSSRNSNEKEESGVKRNNCCVNRWRLSEGLHTDPGWGGNQTFCKCQTGGRLPLTAEQPGCSHHNAGDRDAAWTSATALNSVPQRWPTFGPQDRRRRFHPFYLFVKKNKFEIYIIVEKMLGNYLQDAQFTSIKRIMYFQDMLESGPVVFSLSRTLTFGNQCGSAESSSPEPLISGQPIDWRGRSKHPESLNAIDSEFHWNTGTNISVLSTQFRRWGSFSPLQAKAEGKVFSSCDDIVYIRGAVQTTCCYRGSSTTFCFVAGGVCWSEISAVGMWV